MYFDDLSQRAAHKLTKTLYGDYDGNCVLHPLELTALRQIIYGVNPYDPLYDFDCDGQVTNEVELAQFYYNYLNWDELISGLCGAPEGAAGGGGGDSVSLAEDELLRLAAFVAESLSTKELERFIQITYDTADRFKGTKLGDEFQAFADALGL